MGITDEFARLSADVGRVFSPDSSVATYHLRKRAPAGSVTAATGVRTTTDSDYLITGACVPLAITQGFGAGLGGGKGRPSEDRPFIITVAALDAAGMDLVNKGPDNWSAIIENKDQAGERHFEITRADLIAGGTAWRVHTRQHRFGGQVT